MAIVHHRYATVDGHRLFYREAGDAEAPVACATPRLSDQLPYVSAPDSGARRRAIA